MKVLAVYSIKGGVGKTSSAVNLAYIAANSGLRTLIWDLDPQAASTFYFRVKAKIKGGSKKLIAGKHNLDDLIKATDFVNLDLLPADFSFRNMDLVLDASKKPTQQLKKLLIPLAEEYDVIFLDCPPGITLLSEAIFKAADVLLTPIIPTTLSLRTLAQLQTFLAEYDSRKLQLIPFLSMVDTRKKMHKEIWQQLITSYPELLATAIPYASDIERMGLERKPLCCYRKNSQASRAYLALWQEIIELLDS